MENKRFLKVSGVAAMMEVSETMAYKIIRGLNAGLRTKGYLTVAGRVNRVYFEEKIYSGRSA